MSSSVVVLLIVLVAAAAFGLWRRATDGKPREVAVQRGPHVPLGRTATLVQFSSVVCAPCAATRRLLAEFAETPGVVHMDLDVEVNLDLVREFDITRTPTVLLLGPDGDVRQRVVGMPDSERLRTILVNMAKEPA